MSPKENPAAKPLPRLNPRLKGLFESMCDSAALLDIPQELLEPKDVDFDS